MIQKKIFFLPRFDDVIDLVDLQQKFDKSHSELLTDL
jgi:hypothetical protein